MTWRVHCVSSFVISVAMEIGFRSEEFTAKESDGKATVFVDILNSPEGALEPFTVALVPVEGKSVPYTKIYSALRG